MQKTSLLDVNGAAKVGLDPRTFSFYITPLESLCGIHQSHEISHPIATMSNFETEYPLNRTNPVAASFLCTIKSQILHVMILTRNDK